MFSAGALLQNNNILFRQLDQPLGQPLLCIAGNSPAHIAGIAFGTLHAAARRTFSGPFAAAGQFGTGPFVVAGSYNFSIGQKSISKPKLRGDTTFRAFSVR